MSSRGPSRPHIESARAAAAAATSRRKMAAVGLSKSGNSSSGSALISNRVAMATSLSRSGPTRRNNTNNGMAMSSSFRAVRSGTMFSFQFPLVAILAGMIAFGVCGVWAEEAEPFEPADRILLYGDKCDDSGVCSFPGGLCHPDEHVCRCEPELPVTNNINKCGKAASLNEECLFNEQCEITYSRLGCKEGRCRCQFEWEPIHMTNGTLECIDPAGRGTLMFGDKCESTTDCGFAGSVCDSGTRTCQCTSDLPATNHLDKCGKKAQVNESCFFTEQCEQMTEQTECRDGRCICRFEMNPIFKPDGTVECRATMNKPIEPEKYIDPAMIGVLVAMAVMFIIICVVLRLFSKARWRDNRTIFNTPNPRLMNVSLLRDNKLLHGQERRGSRMSVRLPSRQPSMASLRPHSPNASLGKLGSRRGSRGSSNASATSTRSNRSQHAKDNGTAHHQNESVTVEISEVRS
ncbi:multiple epidermal growth factor-like domains protein 10 isoform X2 [Armigeres subalbatus]|uniref:multiple epidermal growth factor-like domains protein 10 isoform X2 n=1 Tax=Armigeres subalbatus TaxID=124917 RepID=UPI002ED57E61